MWPCLLHLLSTSGFWRYKVNQIVVLVCSCLHCCVWPCGEMFRFIMSHGVVFRDSLKHTGHFEELEHRLFVFVVTMQLNLHCMYMFSLHSYCCLLTCTVKLKVFSVLFYKLYSGWMDGWMDRWVTLFIPAGKLGHQSSGTIQSEIQNTKVQGKSKYWY